MANRLLALTRLASRPCTTSGSAMRLFSISHLRRLLKLLGPFCFIRWRKKMRTEGFEFNLRLLAGFHLPITCCCQQRFPPPVISFHGCASQPTGRPPGALLRRRVWEFVNIMGSFFLPTAEAHYTLYSYISTAHVLL